MNRNEDIEYRLIMGQSYGWIARELGITRNAVAGVARRAGIAGPIGSQNLLPRGADHPRPRAKLSEAKVRALRAEDDLTCAQGAAKYCISAQAYWLARTRRSWAHVQ